ncbi:MAG: T9SS type A sorting domain-containing protein, partial [Ferruginibacter sp.]|nr:T9SS type A sorting domain-containing protein [Ferruginibacter sp.]
TVTINWGVQTEANINNYSIEQSNDGSNFAQIKTQTPTANNGGNANYSIIDATASKAANWYRVKYTNITGNVKYTSIAMVSKIIDATEVAENSINIYPTIVTNNKINIQFTNQNTGKYAIKVTNNLGQIIKKLTTEITDRNALKIIDLHNIALGNYQISLQDANGKKTTVSFIVK